MQKPAPSPEQEAALATENTLLLQAQNEYLKQRVVALSTRVREQATEIQRLTSEPTEGRHRADS